MRAVEDESKSSFELQLWLNCVYALNHTAVKCMFVYFTRASAWDFEFELVHTEEHASVYI